MDARKRRRVRRAKQVCRRVAPACHHRLTSFGFGFAMLPDVRVVVVRRRVWRCGAMRQRPQRQRPTTKLSLHAHEKKTKTEEGEGMVP